MSDNNVDKTTLHEIVHQVNVITEMLIERGGELDPDLEKALTNIDLQIAKKVDGYSIVMDRLDTEADYWKKKSLELKKVSDSCLSVKERIKNSIKAAMVSLGRDEILGEDYRFKLSKGVGKLVIDESKLPGNYLIEVVDHVPDKARIKEKLQQGMEIEGARIEDSWVIRTYHNRGNTK